MLAATLITSILIALATLTLVVAAFAYLAQRGISVRVRQTTSGDAAHRVRGRLVEYRTRLVEAHSGSQRALGALERLDQRVDEATVLLYRSRIGLADQHSRLLAARAAVERMRLLLRNLVRINQIRRMFTG